MEQLYLIEIFVKSVSIFLDEEDERTNTNKDLFIRCMFGPKTQFLFKEAMMVAGRYQNVDKSQKTKRKEKEKREKERKEKERKEKERKEKEKREKEKGKGKGKDSEPEPEPEPEKEEEVESDTEDHKQRKWTRGFRIGKSILFPAFPDNLELILEKYPLQFSLWSNEIDESPELIGTGTMHWHTQYFSHLRENTNPCLPHKALSSKEIVPIMNECCCTQAGELYFVLRVSPLGFTIMCEFQQRLDKDPDSWVFRSDKCPSKFSCKRIEIDDKKYRTMGSIYEIAVRDDPIVQKKIKRKVEICTELESCGVPQPGATFACQHRPGVPENFDSIAPKEYPIEKIKMGDIVGPCGNANCLIAHKMRVFVRNQYAYKKETLGRSFGKSKKTKRVCGQCGCKHDLVHVEKPDPLLKKPICQGCGGVAQSGETCADRLNKLHGTGVTPISSKTEVRKQEDRKK